MKKRLTRILVIKKYFGLVGWAASIDAAHSFL
jgi:hypothetical protein